MFFENKNQATENRPYFNGHSRNINYPSHIHQEIELVLVKRGRVSVVGENGQFIAEEGDICIFMPGEIHSFSSITESHLYILKMYAGATAEKLDFSVMRAETNPLRQGRSLNTTLREKMELVKRETEERLQGYTYKANSLANDMLCDILRSSALKEFNPDEKRRHLSALTLLTATNKLVRERYSEQITLSDAADACNLSKYYFAHFFKEITGSTFLEYLTLFRLERALPLLSCTEKTVVDVAYDCGFSNIRSFNRAFKKYIGLSPSEYRKNASRA